MAGNLKSIAVYCGHQIGKDPQFKRDARAVGRMLAKNGIRMVFGGGDGENAGLLFADLGAPQIGGTA